MASRSSLYAAFLLLLISFPPTSWVKGNDDDLPPQCRELSATSAQRLQFALNLHLFEAEYYLRSSIGRGIDDIAPGLVQGPAPIIGTGVANLDNVTRDIIEELGYQAIGNIKAILKNTRVDPIERPLLNISGAAFSNFVNGVLNTTLSPPFNNRANTINFLVTAYPISEVVKQYFVGIVPLLNNDLQEVATRILGTVSGRVVAQRTLAYLRVNDTLQPYQFTVANLSSSVARFVNGLGNCGEKDEGLLVSGGAERRSGSNVVPGDINSLSVSRTERELLRILYGTGNASRAGGIFPNGLNGDIARTIRRRGII